MSRSPADSDYLYVPDDERDEALFLGARLVPGDSRLAIPRPLPQGITAEDFASWRTLESRYRWCLRLVRQVLGDTIHGIDAANRTAGSPDIRQETLADILNPLARGAAQDDRVYLYVTAQEGVRIRQTPGIGWDRRRHMYFASKHADLGRLFRYLTPAARAAWESERLADKTTSKLMQELAREEVKRRHGGGSGGIASERQDSKAAKSAAAAQPQPNTPSTQGETR